MDFEHDMTPGFQNRWMVMIGNLYIAGLGRTYEGYHKGDRIPMIPGYVVTKLQSHAMEFTSRREAGALATSIGGRVIRSN